MPLNCTLKNCQNGKFYFIHIHIYIYKTCIYISPKNCQNGKFYLIYTYTYIYTYIYIYICIYIYISHQNKKESLVSAGQKLLVFLQSLCGPEVSRLKSSSIPSKLFHLLFRRTLNAQAPWRHAAITSSRGPGKDSAGGPGSLLSSENAN